MNREIKFRAWDDKSEKMFENVGLTITECIVYKHDNKLIAPEEDWRFGRDAVHIMQFTSLKDKNGVDIYEGDKIKIYYGSNDSIFGIGEVYYDDKHQGYYAKGCVVERYCSYKVEVIGNIYETNSADETT